MSRPQQGIAEEVAFLDLFEHGAVWAFLLLKRGECVLEFVVEGLAFAVEVPDAFPVEEVVDGGEQVCKAFLRVGVVRGLLKEFVEVDDFDEVSMVVAGMLWKEVNGNIIKC